MLVRICWKIVRTVLLKNINALNANLWGRTRDASMLRAGVGNDDVRFFFTLRGFPPRNHLAGLRAKRIFFCLSCTTSISLGVTRADILELTIRRPPRHAEPTVNLRTVPVDRHSVSFAGLPQLALEAQVPVLPIQRNFTMSNYHKLESKTVQVSETELMWLDCVAPLHMWE